MSVRCGREVVKGAYCGNSPSPPAHFCVNTCSGAQSQRVRHAIEQLGPSGDTHQPRCRAADSLRAISHDGPPLSGPARFSASHPRGAMGRIDQAAGKQGGLEATLAWLSPLIASMPSVQVSARSIRNRHSKKIFGNSRRREDWPQTVPDPKTVWTFAPPTCRRSPTAPFPARIS